jgi:CheY-like chemotaxis protein
VLLPFSPPPRRPAEEDGAAAGERSGLAGLSALVVDDEADAREVLREILVRAGMSVEAVPSADAAVESLDARKFDVLISDIGMPAADGISLVRRVRASPHAAIAAIAVTAYAREEERVLALAAGFDRHLAKPVEPASLVAAVRELTVGIRSAGTSRGGACRVLVVEDDGDSREGLKRFLELYGHTVDVAGTGLDGIEKALRDRPDVAFVDISLPDVDGHEVARRIREWLSKEEIQLVALTGYRGLAARREAMEAGFDVHVSKPVDLAGLEALLRPAGRRGS